MAHGTTELIRQGEKEWHEKLFASRASRPLIVPPAIRARYLNPPKRPLFEREHLFHLAGDVRGKRVLVFGCGDENSTVILALKGAEVWAFDLSEEAVQIQRQLALANGVHHRVRVSVCAAEQLTFADHQFDLVFGSAILHHIPNHRPSLPAHLLRIMKPDGLALFSEPIIRSRTLGWILRKLPGHQEISPGERQLVDDDFGHFLTYFDLHFSYFCFLSRLDRFLLRGPLEYAPRWTKALVCSAHALDYALLNVLCLTRLAGTAVVAMRPKATTQPSAVPDWRRDAVDGEITLISGRPGSPIHTETLTS